MTPTNPDAREQAEELREDFERELHLRAFVHIDDDNTGVPSAPYVNWLESELIRIRAKKLDNTLPNDEEILDQALTNFRHKLGMDLLIEGFERGAKWMRTHLIVRQ